MLFAFLSPLMYKGQDSQTKKMVTGVFAIQMRFIRRVHKWESLSLLI